MSQSITVTVDVVLLTLRGGQLYVVLHTRGHSPEAGKLALPGGFVHTEDDRSTQDAAKRVLLMKTGIVAPYLAQLRAFSGPSRDPDRGWSISDAYYALVGDDTLYRKYDECEVYPVDALPELAFDHADIIKVAVSRVRNQSSYSSLPCYLLPEQFTLSELMETYEAVLNQKLDKSLFRSKVRNWTFIEPVPGAMRQGRHRPAQLYRLQRDAQLEFFNNTI